MHGLAVYSFDVAQKRSNNPNLEAFGRRLAGLRGGRSREWVSKELTRLGTPLGGSTLAQYEKGFVWAPDPAVLMSLAAIYKTSHSQLVAMLKENRKRPKVTEWSDLLGHDLTIQPEGNKNYAAGVSTDAPPPPSLPEDSFAPAVAVRPTLVIATELREHAAALSALADDLVRRSSGRRSKPRPSQKAGSPHGAPTVHRTPTGRGTKRGRA